MLDTIRYVVALLFVVTFIPAIFFWMIVHPFIGFWRRLGPWLTYPIVTALLVPIGVAVYRVRGPLLSVDFGTNYVLLPLAILVYALAVVVEIRARKHLKFRTLVGLPELTPQKSRGKLLTEGIYSRVRHPRYLSVIVGLVGWAFFANYLAVYLLVPLVMLAGYVITVLEEKELLDRFGEEYERYRERVPRFIPRR